MYCTKAIGPKAKNSKNLGNEVMFYKLIKTCVFLSPLPLIASKRELLSEVTATLHINEQKNSFKGAYVHHGAL